MERLAVSVDEAAKALGIGRTLAYEAVKAGDIPAIRVGQRWLVSVAGLQSLLEGTRDTQATGESAS